jgi:putative transposase
MPTSGALARVRRLWRTPDALWAQLEPLLPARKVHPLGCRNPRADDRRAMDAIRCRLRTGGWGCQGNALSATGLGSSSAAHRRCPEWRAAGVFLEPWRRGLTEDDALEGIARSRPAAAGAMAKAPLEGKASGRNPTGRGQRGAERSALTEASGVPVGAVAAGANRHARMLLARALDSIPLPRPTRGRPRPPGVWLDKAYDGDRVYALLSRSGGTAHARGRREGAWALQRAPGARARRWAVERTHSRLNRFRAQLVRRDKQTANYVSSLHLACAYITFARTGLLG